MIGQTIQRPKSHEGGEKGGAGRPAASIPPGSRSGSHPPGGSGRFGNLAGRGPLSGRTDVARACRGDDEAFSRLVEAHSDLVRGLAVRLLGPDDAEEASQETWMRVWRNLKSFRGESAFATWLYRVATNSCLSMRRDRARRNGRQPGIDGTILMAEPSGSESDPEVVVLRAEQSGEIADALRRVRGDHRAALVLRHMEGFSYAEVSDALGVPVGTAKGWVSRGRDALLVALTEGNGA